MHESACTFILDFSPFSTHHASSDRYHSIFNGIIFISTLAALYITIGNKFIFNFPASRGLSQQQEKCGKRFSLLARKYSTPRGPTHKCL